MKEGILFVNDNGRYQIAGRHELTCGNAFEIELNGVWVPTAIEHTDGCQFGYYAIGLMGLPLKGKKVRY
ncbi:MAG: DUF5348 domain-containing protein [Christensenellaceae bacterium]